MHHDLTCVTESRSKNSFGLFHKKHIRDTNHLYEERVLCQICLIYFGVAEWVKWAPLYLKWNSPFFFRTPHSTDSSFAIKFVLFYIEINRNVIKVKMKQAVSGFYSIV